MAAEEALSAAALVLRVVLVLWGAFVFFGCTVPALEIVGRWAAFFILPIANRQAALCRYCSSSVITVFGRDG